MNKREWTLAISPLFLTWGLDHVTKLWASGLTDITFYGPLGFLLHHNPGAMLGLFSELPRVLRIVSLSTGGAFLLFLFAIIQFMLPSKLMLLRVGLSFLMGGILGNVTDRILWGHVVDFIVIGTRTFLSPAFNIADALQWVGYFCVVIAFIKDGKELWPAVNLRKSYWINPKFQLKYCFVLTLAGFGVMIISGTFSYTYMRVAIHELTFNNPAIENKFLGPFLLTFSIISVTFSVMLFVIGLMISHRAAGPLYAFERFLNDHLHGKNSKLKLRAGDEFRHLEDLANKMNDQFTVRTKD